METSIQKKEALNTIRDLLTKSLPQIQMAVPKHLTPERLVRIALTTFQRNPRLLECDAKSLLGAIIQCGQLGLEPDDILGRAYLVPFRNNKMGRTDVQLIIGYKGLIDLARRSAKVSDIYARIVYEKEPYNLEYGTEALITHKPLPPAERGEKIIAVYAVAHFCDGGKAFEWLWFDEVQKIRQRSKAKDNGPWVTDFDQMVLKTAIRRLAKYLPMSVEFQKAVALDELGDLGKSQKEVYFGEEDLIEAETGEVASKTETKAQLLRDRLDEIYAKATAEKSQKGTEALPNLRPLSEREGIGKDFHPPLEVEAEAPDPEGLTKLMSEAEGIEYWKAKISEGLKAIGKDEQKFYQACVHSSAKLLGKWGEADYKEACTWMNQVGDGTLETYIVDGQPRLKTVRQR